MIFKNILKAKLHYPIYCLCSSAWLEWLPRKQQVGSSNLLRGLFDYLIVVTNRKLYKGANVLLLNIKMLIKVPEYKHSTVESTLESALKSNGIQLGSPKEKFEWSELRGPIVDREAKKEDFEARYSRWLNQDVHDKHKRVISKNLLSRYISNPAKYWETVDLEADRAGVSMTFYNGRLGNLEEVDPQDLAQAVNNFYGLKVSPETFVMFAPRLRDIRENSDKYDRAIVKLHDIERQLTEIERQSKFKLFEAARNIANEEDISPQNLFAATGEPRPANAVELSYMIGVGDDISREFLQFLRSQGKPARSKDIIRMFVDYTLKH